MDYHSQVEKPEKKEQIKYEVGTKTHDKRHPRQLDAIRDKNPRPASIDYLGDVVYRKATCTVTVLVAFKDPLKHMKTVR